MSESQPEIDTSPAGADGDDADDQAQGYDPLAALTLPELRAASRELGADVVTQITERGEHYADALGRVLWLHRRRADLSRNPAELWQELEGLTFLQVQEQLAELGKSESGVGPTRRQP